MKKRILSIITALALTLALLPAVVPAGAATHTASSSDEFHKALTDAQDGDTIQLTGSFVLKNPQSNNDSLVIDKAVTIQGGSLTLWYAGILLGADVTFKDITLGLGSNVRPALMANGHTLTLENVQRDPTARHIQLFCGGLTGGTQGDLAAAKQGGHGQIIIRGNTNLGPTGRIFAGSISTDGNSNVFEKPATVTIESSVKGDPIGEVYACGALETPTSENDWFDYEHEINPPFASPGNFQVSGKVIFNLYQSKVGKVSGDTGVGGNLAQVNYNGTDYLNDNLVLSNTGGLTVESGNLAPAAGQLVVSSVDPADRTSEIVPVSGGSCFGSTNAPLGVTAGATLGLQKLGEEVAAGDFTGGGNLVLGQSQKLTVAGTVSGTTTVGIGGIFNGHSQKVPIVGNTYIDAASSSADSFTLAAPASRPDIELVYQAGGTWKVEEGHKSTDSIVDDFALTSVVLDPNQPGIVSWFATLPFTYVRYAPNSAENPIAFIPLTIKVNGNDTTRIDDNGSFSYKTDTLELVIASDDQEEDLQEELQIYTISPDESQAVPLTGTYVISVTVPASNSGTSQPITRTATLTVKAAGGGTTVIPAPTPNTVLMYNEQEQIGVPLNDAYVLSSGSVASATNAGEYETKVTPADGFVWEEGGNEEKTISWSIAKAENLDLPGGLGAAAPTAYSESDGKLTGTTAEMEYSTDAQFAAPAGTQCTATETTGLPAGDYYVRYREDTNHNPGPAVMVTVPQGPVTVSSVVIDSSSSYKTSYKVGDLLDVTGLTLTVTMSDGNTYTVPVAAGMVSGFNSSAPAASQTLTVTYGGKTTTYTIQIEANTNPVASIAITSTGHKTRYKVGEPLDVTGLKLTVTRQDGATEEIDVLAGMVTGFNSGSPVESQTLTVTYGGQTVTYNISIAEASSGGDTGGGSTGSGGSSGGGGGSSTGGSSSNTTTAPDGTVTTTVTDERTGTVTTTTRKPDGSTTVVEAKKDGTVTVTDTAKNGVKVEAVSKPETDTSARVTLPMGVKTATVTVPVTVTSGMVAVDAKTGEIVKLSVPTGDGMLVKLDGSADLILVDRSKPFTDTDGHWAKDAIDFATAHAMFNGTSATTFSPNDAMTRGMIAVVLHNFEDNPKFTAQNSFSDVGSGAWYADGINWMVEKGIAGGYGDGSFGTNDFVTREQLVTFLYRYANSMGYSTAVSADLSGFADGDSVSGYAAEAMRWAVGSGLIVGGDGGALDPQSSATRAQVAAILNRFVINLTC